MKESLSKAEQQLKRVDHLIYVSLKYTRTVDILKNTVNRIIQAYDAGMVVLFDFLKETEKIEDIPKSPGLRANILRKTFGEEIIILEFLQHYLHMREILRSDFDRREEFRRGVTMISRLKGHEVEVTIDSITEDYKKVKTFVALVGEYVGNEGQGDMTEMLKKVLLELEFDRRYY